jgi:hypothetical protein
MPLVCVDKEEGGREGGGKESRGAAAHVSVDMEEERKQEDAPCLRRQGGWRKRESKRSYLVLCSYVSKAHVTHSVINT